MATSQINPTVVARQRTGDGSTTSTRGVRVTGVAGATGVTGATRQARESHPHRPFRAALRGTGIFLDTAWRVVLLGDQGVRG
jgi:hypothetical protein